MLWQKGLTIDPRNIDYDKKNLKKYSKDAIFVVYNHI